MECRWLGWAGLELEHAGQTLVIDPLHDAAAVFANAGPGAEQMTLPELVPPAAGRAVAAAVTHLHRDHADAGALVAALAPGATVLGPASTLSVSGSDEALSLARHELGAHGLSLRELSWGETFTAGPFSLTALPAVDGTGDPQVSWLVQAGAHRVLHCGDTMFHGWWWRMAELAGQLDAVFLPVNGAVVRFPWRRPSSPLPAVMTPEQAAAAARALKARCAVPIHFGAFDIEPFYRSVPAADARFMDAARSAGVPAQRLQAGETYVLGDLAALAS